MSTVVTDPLVGTVLDRRYRVDGPLARGGMSTVYLGTDLRLDRRVAVKVMAPALAHDPAFTDRFVREARSAARLSHPNAVAVFDQGAEETPAGRVVFLVMELVRGSTLRDLLHRRGRLRPDEAVSVLEPVLGALAAAHRAGLVHRDVKPENVLLSADGTVKVADFGLARAVAAPSTSTQAGVVLGTVAYVAPEQVRTGSADARTDVYSAGILLYELLTGVPPYTGDSALAVAYRHVHDDVPPPSAAVPGIGPALDELVLRATRREPGGRPADAGAFLAELAMTRTDLGLRRVPIPSIAPAEPPARPPGGPGSPAGRGGPGNLGRPAGPGGPGGPAGRGGTGWADADATGLVAGGPARAGTAMLPAYREPPARHAPRGGATAAAPRRRWGAWVALLSIILLALGTGAVAWWYGDGRFVQVPPVAGLTRQAAAARLDAAGLAAGFSSAPSDTVTAGRAIGTQPRAGDRLVRGRTVTVVLSSGPQLVDVPDVTGGDRGEAEAAIRRAGLQPVVIERPDEDEDAGNVLSQSPEGGRARRGSQVTIVVSTGEDLVVVPDVIGSSVSDARRILEEAGFKVRTVSLKIGNVVQQRPAAGERVRRGARVTIIGL
ncbi:MAG TPA: PASTA domain-containing protein [Mycobacteriales bacterium]